MARPKKEIQKKKKNCIMLRLSDTEYEIVTNYAKEAGYPSAVYARKQILEMSIQFPFRINQSKSQEHRIQITGTEYS